MQRCNHRRPWCWIAIVTAIGLGGGPLVAEDSVRAARQRIDGEFQPRVRDLAERCLQLQMPAEAAATRQLLAERDTQRQYLYVPGLASEPLAARDAELARKWQAKFAEIRRERAEKLFELARQQASGGSATVAYQLLHEVLVENPDHVEARRILQRGTVNEARPRARASRLAHPQFGWARGKWWQIESPHFQIATDDGPEAGIELAERLEELHCVWQQLFFEYWNSSPWLEEQFAGSATRSPPRRQHRAVLFRDRGEYLERLGQAEPNIKVTLGYYHKANQTAYFYAGDKSLLHVWLHEATHQLFQENNNAVPDVGERRNFWVVEGIAVYLESLVREGDHFTVGGFDSDRLQFARSRILGGERPLPLNQLTQLGRLELQQHPDIRRLYTQAAGWTHFFLDFDHGRYRNKFQDYLRAVYRGDDEPESLLQRVNATPEELDASLVQYLTVNESELRFVSPARGIRNLSLLRGEISDQGLAYLRGLDQLEWLDLSFNPLTDDGLEQLAGLKNLRRLTLVGVPIGDAGVTKLTALESLEELDLAATRITDGALADVGRLTKLTGLRLSHTAVTDEGLSSLSSLRMLEELDVDQTSVTAAAVERLKQQLPHLK